MARGSHHNMAEMEDSLTLSRDVRRACELLEKLQVGHFLFWVNRTCIVQVIVRRVLYDMG